jgi:hypothetical protein
MVEPRNSDQIENLMKGLLAEGGETPAGVGWPKPGSQELRFEQLLRLIDPEDREFTINDVGCGFADLYGFIRGRGLPMSAYYGYDLTEEMLEVAKGRVGEDAELFHSAGPAKIADYSFACGLFNSKFDESDADWIEYVKSVVRELDQHSKRGFAFNSLTDRVDYREPHLFYADPLELFNFCRDEISPRVALLHDYPLYEWTILVRSTGDS